LAADTAVALEDCTVELMCAIALAEVVLMVPTYFDA